jgi:hypothetical protein
MRRLSMAAALLLCACGAPPPAAQPLPRPAPGRADGVGSCPEAPALGRIRFRITADRALGAAPITGRLLVLWSTAPDKKDTLEMEWNNTQIASMPVDSMMPGAAFDFDPDLAAFPKPFSQMPAGTYQLMAVLDTDASFLRAGLDAGDLYSAVVQLPLDPGHNAPVDLRLDKRVPTVTPVDPEGVTTVHFQSPLLTSFFGRPTEMRAVVALPPGADSKKRLPTVYLIPGYGGPYNKIDKRIAEIRKAMTAAPWSEMAFVYLDGDIPAGHHVFADSVNTGPYNRAFVEELVPELEKRFPLVAKPEARFVTGHSSGGWASLWLLVTHPGFFGGAWSTSPDPIDFRSFFGADITPGSTDNVYRSKDGRPRNLLRNGGHELMSVEEWARLESAVIGDRGGPLSTMEWVFSPRAPGGGPVQLFNRKTGEVSPEAQRSWAKFDIHQVLASRWKELGPRLQGKVHIVCGAADSFHLDEAVTRLCGFLKEKGSDATCEMVPGGDHFNLYGKEQTAQNGLLSRMVSAMLEQYRGGPKVAKKAAAAAEKPRLSDDRR